MKIVLAPNAFKESLDANEVCSAMEDGVRRAVSTSCPSLSPTLTLSHVPLGDGGDGTMSLLVDSKQGKYVKVSVKDPLFREVEGTYGLIDDGATAVVEMADPSGLWRLKENEKDPLECSSIGFGQLVAHALSQGVSKMLLCIGGSATNDGGCGLAKALGYRFYDEEEKEIEPKGGNIHQIRRIDSTNRHKGLDKCEVFVACDVDNPLLGPNGATAIYGPQKGATTQDSRDLLEKGLLSLSLLWKQEFNQDIAHMPGAGAAGGMGAGLSVFCGAKLCPGFDMVAAEMGLDAALVGASLVLTGEGRIDESTAAGKVPYGVAVHARDVARRESENNVETGGQEKESDSLKKVKGRRIPVFAIAGSKSSNLSPLYSVGLSAVVAIAPGPITLSQSQERAAELIAEATFQVLKVYLAGAGFV